MPGLRLGSAASEVWLNPSPKGGRTRLTVGPVQLTAANRLCLGDAEGGRGQGFSGQQTPAIERPKITATCPSIDTLCLPRSLFTHEFTPGASFIKHALGVGGSILISIVSIPTLVSVSDRY